MPNIKVNDVIMLDSLSSDCILQSLEKAGLEPEYQCRDGHCGSCRCKLVEGQVSRTETLNYIRVGVSIFIVQMGKVWRLDLALLACKSWTWL